jgi:hypothetical protein
MLRSTDLSQQVDHHFVEAKHAHSAPTIWNRAHERSTDLSQQIDHHFVEANHAHSAPTIWNRSHERLRKNTTSLHNHEGKTMIPVRHVSASIDHSHFIEHERKRNFDRAFDVQEIMYPPPTLPYFDRHFSMPHICPFDTITTSYSKNVVEEPGIGSYLAYSPHPYYDCRMCVVSPRTPILQYQPIYHDSQFRKKSSYVCDLSTDYTFAYTNEVEEKKQKTTQNIRASNSNKRLKSARKRKPKDRPKRPLSAYNLYFQQERQNILSEIPDTNVLNEPFKRKRRARPKIPHGKIGFESLAKEIGQRWQRLTAEQINHYKGLAMKEMTRYKEAMRIYRGNNETNPESSATPGNVLNAVNNHVDNMSEND